MTYTGSDFHVAKIFTDMALLPFLVTGRFAPSIPVVSTLVLHFDAFGVKDLFLSIDMAVD